MQTKISKFIPGIIFLTVLIMTGCEDRIYEEYSVMNPVYMSYEDLRTAVNLEGPKELSQPGKIYLKDNFIFINEYFEGIHIVDNSDPSSPVVAGFVNIPGNVDMAVIGNILYADSFTDLVVLDIADVSSITEIDRIEEIFPYAVPDIGDAYLMVGNVVQEQGVVVGWEKEVRREEINSLHQSGYGYLEDKAFRSFAGFQMSSQSLAGASAGKASSGKAGSMARFGIFDNYLYAIDDADMHILNIQNISSPVKSGIKNVGWNIETMFIYGDKMFIGGQSGMYIYDLQNPGEPKHLSTYWHITSCDPVVVEGERAYVTLRAGTFCGGMDNRLEVIDISDLKSPQLIKAFPMTEPYGLGIDNKVLFICEGDNGLSVYDASDSWSIASNKIAVFPDIHAFDVIPVDGLLLMIGLDGLYQYDYSDLTDIIELSFLPIYSKN